MSFHCRDPDMLTTFTIQSVHGLKETFVLSPNGTVSTTQPKPDDRLQEPEPKSGSAASEQNRPR